MTCALPLVAPGFLKRRFGRGKEDPDRWTEKLGQPRLDRPVGPLIWFNAVGLGEVLSLRGLINEFVSQNPDMSVLVTSTTKDSAKVFDQNLPERTCHQFLPIDAPKYRKAFLKHWRPDMLIWAEQEIWPGFVWEAHQLGIPQAIIAARMNQTAFKSRAKFRSLFEAMYARMSLITAQDEETAHHLKQLGARDVRITGSLKPAAPPLSANADDVSQLNHVLGRRFVWVAVSSYIEDEQIALEAHEIIRASYHDALLIVVPRQRDRSFAHLGDAPRRSYGETPDAHHAVWLADTVGEMGLFLSIAKAALIGGTFNETEGHNPWEAAALGVPSFHGPRTNNFKHDFQELDKNMISTQVETASTLAYAVLNANLDDASKHALQYSKSKRKDLKALATELLTHAGCANG